MRTRSGGGKKKVEGTLTPPNGREKGEGLKKKTSFYHNPLQGRKRTVLITMSK